LGGFTEWHHYFNLGMDLFSSVAASIYGFALNGSNTFG
jgi:hypothetical protein